MDEQNTMADFMDEIEKSMRKVYQDDVLKGTIISANEEEVLVNINHTSDGIINKEEMAEDYAYNIGDDISVLVLNPHDNEGNVILSHKSAEEIVGWDELEEAYNEKKKIKVKVNEVVKGGVTAAYRSVRCFIPGSLLSYKFVEDMNTYVGKVLEVVIEDFDREKNKIVLSRKAIEVVERQGKMTQMMDELQVGEMRQGFVTKLMKFGAFVDLGGVEGLIYLDDLAWHRVNDPSEIVSVGDNVTVFVSNIDKRNDKISLVLKKVDEDPWQRVSEYFKVDDVVGGKVVRLTDFGAFVEIKDGIDGLVHLSEISSQRIRKVSDVLKVGDKVQAVILNIDEKNKRLSLSIKEAEGQSVEKEEFIQDEQSTTLGDLLGDKFKDFFKK